MGREREKENVRGREIEEEILGDERENLGCGYVG